MQLMEKFVLPAGQILHWLWSRVSMKKLSEKEIIKTLTHTFRQHTHGPNLHDRSVKTQIFPNPKAKMTRE